MKIKVIDIMNKIYNKETVPKKIMYDFKTYFYDEATQDYTDYDRTYGLFSDLLDKQYGIFNCLNDEVEIIEEEKLVSIPESEYLKWLDFKALGNKPCEEETPTISKLYINGELQYDLKEEKKIPEKLKEFGLIQYNLEYIDYKNIETLKEWLNKDFQTIYDTIDLIIKNQNGIIDYLKSKGE